MYVETVYSATIDNQTVFVKVAEQMETKNDAKIQAMKDVINAFVLPGQQGHHLEERHLLQQLPSDRRHPYTNGRISTSEANM